MSNGNETRQLTTYTMWNLFRNCRRACYWRYQRHLVPKERDSRPLRLGSAVHQALEVWHGTNDLPGALAVIDAAYVNRSQEPDEKRDWHYATAMMKAYVGQYPQEPWEVVALEKVFRGDIVNPRTGARSRSFVLGGKADGIIAKPSGSTYLLEHKTAASIGGDYVGKLWTDLQIVLYSFYLRRFEKLPIEGVIYNVLAKPRLTQAQGETEEAFQARAAQLAARNKSGKSSAQRRVPETDEEFQARLAAWYGESERFLRVELVFDHDTYVMLQSELWELTQQLLDARRRNMWYQNTSYCFSFHRPCPYFPICSSKDNPLVIDTQYEVRPPHEELNPAEKSGPTF